MYNRKIFRSSKNDFIPKGIYDTITSKIENSSLLKEEDVNIMIVNLSPDYNPQIIAYLNIGLYDSLFIIFEKINGQYNEVFSKKSWYISSVEVDYPNIILKILENSGTGFATYNYYLIRNTTKGYREVWSGLSHKYELVPREFNYEIISGLNSYFYNQIIHFTVSNEYKGMDIESPIKTNQTYKIFKYNENTMVYEPI